MRAESGAAPSLKYELFEESFPRPFGTNVSDEYPVPFMACVQAHHWGIDRSCVVTFTACKENDEDRFLAYAPKSVVDRILAVRAHARAVLCRCQSPIEELFVSQMYLAAMVYWRTVAGVGADDPDELVASFGELDETVPLGPLHTQLLQQVEIDRYRLDFALVRGDTRIAIELDGHDFHERTKEQAARDKSRDRRLTELGWRVIRFTGSEVYRDANECAHEAIRILESTFAAATGPAVDTDDNDDGGSQ